MNSIAFNLSWQCAIKRQHIYEMILHTKNRINSKWNIEYLDAHRHTPHTTYIHTYIHTHTHV